MGIAGDEEFRGQGLLGGQTVVVGAEVNLLAQHVGNLAGTVRTGPPDRRRFGLRHADTRAGHAVRTG